MTMTLLNRHSNLTIKSTEQILPVGSDQISIINQLTNDNNQRIIKPIGDILREDSMRADNFINSLLNLTLSLLHEHAAIQRLDSQTGYYSKVIILL